VNERTRFCERTERQKERSERKKKERKKVEGNYLTQMRRKQKQNEKDGNII